jgi:hypothetical protein
MVRRALVRITDRTLIYILSVLLAILSVVVISGNRDARDAAKAAEAAARNAAEAAGFANVLRDCRTPGTECYKYQVENSKNEQDFFIKLVTDASLCNLLSDIRFIPTADPTAIETAYAQCILSRTPPAPNAPIAPPPPPKRPVND